MFAMTEGIWVTIAFFMLIFLIAKPLKKVFLGILDRYITDTRKTLKEAEDLKQEAQLRLDQAKKQLKESKEFSASILKRSEEEAVSIINDAKKFAEDEAKKQITVLVNSFEARKQKLFSEIKQHAVDKAMADIMMRFEESLEQDDDNALLDFGISNFKKTVH